MNTTSIRPKKEEDGDKAKSMSTKAPLTERIMKKAAVAVIATACALAPVSCLLDASGTRSGTPTDAGHDAEVDADHDAADADSDVLDGDVADADTTDGDVLDGDVLDADVADSDITDADVSDADVVDGDLADSDITDGDVLDGDVEEDADLEPLCSGVFDEVITEETFDKGTGRSVGGYMITYVTQTTGGITMNIDCGSDSEEITSGDAITTMVEHTVNVPDDGKRIRITVHSRNTFDATMSVAVEPL